MRSPAPVLMAICPWTLAPSRSSLISRTTTTPSRELARLLFSKGTTRPALVSDHQSTIFFSLIQHRFIKFFNILISQLLTPNYIHFPCRSSRCSHSLHLHQFGQYSPGPQHCCSLGWQLVVRSLLDQSRRRYLLPEERQQEGGIQGKNGYCGR